MAVMEAPIISAEQIYLVCDDDPKVLMKYEGYDPESHKFKYVCPICGRVEYHEQSYPYHRVHFDRSKEVPHNE